MKTTLTALVAAGSVLAALPARGVVIPAACEGSDGASYYDATVLADGLVSTETYVNGTNYLVLASCAGLSQIRIAYDGSGAEYNRISGELIQLLTSAKVYSFEDVKNRFNSGATSAAITPISAALCACLTKDN